jgi:alkylated DNA repair dioxygenase AlkB
LHPEEYGQVSYMGKTVNTPRWQQTYLKDYYFSGMIHKALLLPEELQPFLDWANTVSPNVIYNQVLINWYANGNHYIGPHSDDEKQLVELSPVLSVSLGQERIFRIRQKSTNDTVVDIPMPSDTYVMMCGKMQKKYLHEVPKVTGKKGNEMGRRINITFRVFK